LDRWHLAFEFAQNNREISLLPKNVNAKAGLIAKRIAQITRTTGEVIVNQPTVALHQGKRDLLRLVRSKRFDRRIDIYLFEFAEVLHLQGMAGGKIEIGDATISLQHGRKDFVEIGYSHGLFIGGVHRWLFQELAEFFLIETFIVSFFRRNSGVPQMFHD